MTLTRNDLTILKWALNTLLNELSDDFNTNTFSAATVLLDRIEEEEDEIRMRDVSQD